MTLLARVASGMKWGLAMAAVLIAWAALVGLFNLAVNGSFELRARGGSSMHLVAIIAFYLAGGPLVGGFIGAMQPLLRWKIGAVLLGMAVAVPLFIAGIMLTTGYTSWGRPQSAGLIMFAIAFGGPGGLILRAFVHGPGRE